MIYAFRVLKIHKDERRNRHLQINMKVSSGYNNYIKMPKIQNGLRTVNHAKNKKLFFFQISLRAKREKRKDNPIIMDEWCEDNI